MEKFKIRLFNGPDPQAQYDRLAVKDSHTLYILDLDGENAKAYLGLKPLAGGFSGEAGTVIGQHIETIFEANDTVEGYDAETDPHMPFVGLQPDGVPLPLSKPLSSYDAVRIKVYESHEHDEEDNHTYGEVIYLSGIVDAALLKGNYGVKIISDRYNGVVFGYCVMTYLPEENQLKFNTDQGLCVMSIEGIKYQDARVGRKLYSIYDRLEEDAANGTTDEAGYIPQSVNDQLPEGEELHSFMQIPSIESYDSIIVFADIKDGGTFFVPTHIELPVEYIKEKYKKVVFNIHTSNGSVLGGWLDATTIGINGMTNDLTARIGRIYGVKYETVTRNPLTEATLRELITDVMGKELEKYVEYTVDDGTIASEPEETETA